MTFPSSQSDSAHVTPVILVTGKRLTVTLQLFIGFLLQQNVVQFIIISFFTAWYLYPNEIPREHELWIKAVLMGLGGSIYLAIFCLNFLIVNALNRYFRLVFIVPLHSFISVLIMELVMQVVAYDVGGLDHSEEQSFGAHVFNVALMFLAFEFIMSLFIVPHTPIGRQLMGLEPYDEPTTKGVADSSATGTTTSVGDEAEVVADHPEPSTAPEDRDSDAYVDLFGHQFPVSELILLKSDDHYIFIVTAQGRNYVRGRLSGAMRQMKGHGMQINRSVWVAWDAIVSWEKAESHRLRLTLSNGSHVFVARSRVCAFQELIQQSQKKRTG